MHRDKFVTNSDQFEVVIVGAGPVGLSCAIELGQRGIRCLLVERNDRVGYAPRAKTTNIRTRTHLRRWGIADRLAASSPFGIDYPSNVVFVTRLGGRELARFDNAFNAAPARDPRYPEHAQWIPQYRLEEVLREHVETLATVELRFNTGFIASSEDEKGVAVELQRSDGSNYRAEARYFIGADGARSSVRDQLDIAMRGAYGLSHNYNIVFRAPGLADAHRFGPAIMYWQINGEVPSLIGPMDRGDVWFFMPTGIGDVRLTDDEARALIAQATGIDLPYEILSSDFWVASRLIADRYRSGRTFLAGDACHLHPPFGGYGMNMGIGDAVDLGWKLAATLRGWGGEALLDTYETERKPVHQQIMDEAEANHSLLGNHLWSPGLDDETPAAAAQRADVGRAIELGKAREFRTLGAVLGYRYCGSPVIIGAPESCALAAGDYRPSSEPGCLAPHAWLADGRSLYDLMGTGFTLLARDGAPAGFAARDAAALGVPLTVLPVPAGALDLYPEPLTLIRPDQHVCWRGTDWSREILEQVTGLRGQSPAQPDRHQKKKIGEVDT